MVSPVPAAGTVPWRVRGGELEVALVHRPAYDDWSWPKGKLDPDEEGAAAAARETEEETGLAVRLGTPLPPSSYPFLGRLGEMQTKEVHYWAAEVIGGDGRLVNEIDEVAWLTVAEADVRLDYARDRTQLRAVAAAHTDGALATWPLLIVRHTRAVARSDWKKGADWLRPLDARGKERATTIVPLLAAYAPQRLLTSPSTRCVATIAPYAAATETRILKRPALSEEAYEEDPSGAITLVDRVFRKSVPVALCTHGPVLAGLLTRVAEHVAPTRSELADEIHHAAVDGMAKGELLVAHVSGSGDAARIVALERHLP